MSELWERCFREHTLDVLDEKNAVVPYGIGWMGEHDVETGKFTYIAKKFMPAGTSVPEGFEYRDLPACTIANGFINGDFANGDVFSHSHELM